MVLLHYGNATELRCPRCAAVLRAAGPKWQLMWALTQHPAWRQLSAGRKAVMVADDDVLFTTCEANRCGGWAALGRAAPRLFAAAPASWQQVALPPAPGAHPHPHRRITAAAPLRLPCLPPLPPRVFEVFSAYGLMLGQPSLCATRHRPSWWAHLVQDRGATLRFVTMVEIMVGGGLGWLGWGFVTEWEGAARRRAGVAVGVRVPVPEAQPSRFGHAA